MTFLCFIAAGLVAGQINMPDHKDGSNGRGRTYIFEMEDGQTYYGYLVERDEDRGRLRIELDDPLKPVAARNIQLSLDALQSQMPESTDARRGRIDRALDEAGYVRVALPDGGWKPVSKQEAQLARRAKEMVLAQEEAKQGGNETRPQPGAAPQQTDEAAGKPWFLAGVIVLLGAGVAALLLKWGFSGETSAAP